MGFHRTIDGLKRKLDVQIRISLKGPLMILSHKNITTNTDEALKEQLRQLKASTRQYYVNIMELKGAIPKKFKKKNKQATSHNGLAKLVADCLPIFK